MCYAWSENGIEWIRPDLGDGTNRILKYRRNYDLNQHDPAHYFRPDSTTVFIDYDDPDSSRRYKLYLRNPVVSIRV